MLLDSWRALDTGFLLLIWSNQTQIQEGIFNEGALIVQVQVIQPVLAADENHLGALKPSQCSGLTSRVIRLNWYGVDPNPTKLFLKLPVLCLWICSILVISWSRRGRVLLPFERHRGLLKAEQEFECRLQSQCRRFCWVQGTFLFFDRAVHPIATPGIHREVSPWPGNPQCLEDSGSRNGYCGKR